MLRIQILAGFLLGGVHQEVGSVVEVPRPFALEQISLGRAQLVDEGEEPPTPLTTDSIQHSDPAPEHRDPVARAPRKKK